MGIGENVVRAITREDGIELGTPSRKDFAARVREMAASTRLPAQRSATDFAARVREMAGDQPELMAQMTRGLEPLLAVLASMIEELDRLTKRVLDISSTKRPAGS